MTLPISPNSITANDLNTELNLSSGSKISLNDPWVRATASKFDLLGAAPDKCSTLFSTVLTAGLYSVKTNGGYGYRFDSISTIGSLSQTVIPFLNNAQISEFINGPGNLGTSSYKLRLNLSGSIARDAFYSLYIDSIPGGGGKYETRAATYTNNGTSSIWTWGDLCANTSTGHEILENGTYTIYFRG